VPSDSVEQDSDGPQELHGNDALQSGPSTSNKSNEVPMKFCINCGAKVARSAKFCSECGWQTSVVSSPIESVVASRNEGGRMGFFDAIGHCFRHYSVFDGRASRSEFWNFMLFYILVDTAITILAPQLLVIFALVTLTPSAAVGARRLHDVNRSGWWQLLMVTIIGFIPLIYWWATKGTNEMNRFGVSAE